MIARFEGRLFGPGLPGGGLPATGHWQGDLLQVEGNGVQLQARASVIAAEAAGFNLAQTRVSWKGETGDHAFFIDDATHARAFAAGAPEPLASLLARGGGRRRGMERRFRAGLAVYLLWLALPLIAIALFLFNTDPIAQWVTDKIPHRYEERIGNLVLSRVRIEQRLLDTGPAVDAVRSIGTRLHPGSRYAYRWFVADAKEVNAFALPGGVIVVHAGLIREAGSPEELAGVLAHEVAHVEQRHSLKALVKNAGVGVLLSAVLGDVSGSTIAGWSAYLSQMKFSREAEMDADREGVKRLVAAGIDPRPMAEFFRKMAEKEGKSAEALSVLATHPSSKERLTALQAQLAALPAAQYQPLAVEWETVRSAAAAR